MSAIKTSSTTSKVWWKKLQIGKKNWTVLLRIYIGFFLLHLSLGKFTASYVGEFSRTVSSWAYSSSFEWYRDFLNQYVIPHVKFFAYLTAIGEFYVGIALILGFLTGLAAILGLILNLAYYLGISEGEVLWNYSTMIVCLLVIFFSGAGRVFGLDKYLSKKILFKYLV